MDPSVQKIIIEAKRYLIAAGGKYLGFEEVVVALAALRDDPIISPAVAKALGVKDVLWPESLIEEAKLAANVDAEQAAEKSVELKPNFQKEYNKIEGPTGVDRLDAFLDAVLASPPARQCERVEELWNINQARSKKKKRGGVLGHLDNSETKRNKLESILAENVVGQEEAIRMIGESYVRLLREQPAASQPKRSGVRGVMTFFGPSGVGKTMLAKEFARALGKVEGAPQGKGYEPYVFTDAKVSLAERVRANPRQVLIVDLLRIPSEAELILSRWLRQGGFDYEVKSGGATRSEFCSLAECFVIFITDLSQDFLNSPNRAGVIRDGRVSSEQFFDLLGKIKIQPELLGQLRHGAAVLFNRLNIADYTRLLEQTFAGAHDGKTAKDHLPLVRVDDRKAMRLVILSLLPDLTAERLASEAKNLRNRWADELARSRFPHLEKLDAENVTLSLNCALDAESHQLVEDFVGRRPVRVLVIDNDNRMAGFIQSYMAAQPGDLEAKVMRSANPKTALEDILKHQPEVVLLDLDFPAAQLPGGDIRVLHRQIRETLPSLPLWLFGETESEELDVTDLLESGGARGYFAFREEANETREEEKTGNRQPGLLIGRSPLQAFEELLAEVAFDRAMSELSQQRIKLVPVYEIVDCDPEAKEPMLEVRITRIRSEQHLSLIVGDFAPVGVPPDRWEDVSGCKRAIDRLKAAIDMFKGNGPARLAKLGERAPTGYLLAGPPGTGKTLLARATAGEAKCSFHALSGGELESEMSGGTEKNIRDLFEAARRNAPSIIFIDEIDSIAAKRTEHSSQHSIKALNQLLTCMDGFAKGQSEVLVLAATNRPEELDKAIKRAGRFDETIMVDLPDTDVRKEFFIKLLKERSREPEVDAFIPELVSQSGGMSPAELRRILREAAYRAFEAKRETLTREDLEKSLILVRSGISTNRVAPAERPKVTFDDVFGLERAKKRLEQAVEMLENGDLLAKFNGVRAPSGYLLAGPPGTGKTHLARAVANKAKGYFFSLSAGELQSKWVGESEERIRQLFTDARQYTPAVIFIDEIDAIAGRRDPSSSEYSGKILNQLLTCMDGFADTKGQVLVLAATNRPEALDPAITRPGRFDEIIPIEEPSAAARKEMLTRLLEKQPREPDVDDAIPRLMRRTAGMSPAELDRVIREAVYLAVQQKREEISVSDLENAANHVRYGAERDDLKVTAEDSLRTAWHEAGHAVARLVLFPGEELDLVTIVPSESGALGLAAWRRLETRHGHSAQDYRDLIVVSLAGREAEMLCPLGGMAAVNTGVSSDYSKATQIAWEYVTRFGFDDEFGVFSTAGLPPTIEAALAEPVHARVQKILASCREDCRKLMRAELARVTAFAEALYAKQTLYGEEAKKIFESGSRA